MSRIVWSVGVGGLALALLAAPWLSQPGDGAAAGPVAEALAERTESPRPTAPSAPPVSWAVLPPER